MSAPLLPVLCLALGCSMFKPAAPAVVPKAPAPRAKPSVCTTGPHTLATGESLDLGGGRSVRLEAMGHKIVEDDRDGQVMPWLLFTDGDDVEAIEGRITRNQRDVVWRDLTLTVTDYQLKRSVTFTVSGCS